MATALRRPAPGWPKTARAAAVELGVDRGTLQEWLARGAPGKKRRGFDLDAIRAWRNANVAPPRAPPSGEEDIADRARLLRAQADERQAKAQLAELQLKIQRGEYLEISAVKERDHARIAIVKRGLFALGKVLPDRLVGLGQREMKVIIDTASRGLLERFASM